MQKIVKSADMPNNNKQEMQKQSEENLKQKRVDPLPNKYTISRPRLKEGLLGLF